jgi:hypothetical protein
MAKHQIDLVNTTNDITYDFRTKTIGGVEIVLDPSNWMPVADLASMLAGEGASLIGIEDAGGLFIAGDVETALAELKELADANAAGVGARWTMVDLAVAPAELPTYTSNGAGVGKTLTGDSNGGLTLQSYAWSVGDRILVASVNADGIGTPFADHGIYDVSDPGDTNSPFVLTRSADCDQETDFVQNKNVFVESGSNAGSFYSLGSASVVVDSTSIVFNRIATSAIPNSSVVTAKLGPLAVTSSKLDADSVATSKIIDGAVTDAKIDTMSAPKLTGTIADARIAATSVVQHEDAIAITEAQVTDLQDYALDTARVANFNAIADLETLTGVESTQLGAFTGTTIADSSSIKAALQALETSVESKSTNAEHNSNENLIAALTQLTGAGAAATDMGSWLNNSLPVDADIKAVFEEIGRRTDLGTINFQALQTAVGAATSSVDTIMTDVPMSAGSGFIYKRPDDFSAGDALFDTWGIVQVRIDLSDYEFEMTFENATKKAVFLASASSVTVEGKTVQVADAIDFSFDMIKWDSYDSIELFGAAAAATDWDITVSDASAGANLGSFTGATIADDSTVKGALQALETSLETKAPQASVGAIPTPVYYGDAADDTVGEHLEAIDAAMASVERFVYATVNYNGGDVVIAEMPAGAQILEVRVKIKAAFDGVTPMMSVGHAGDEAALAPDSEFELGDATSGGNPQVLAAWYENSTAKDFKAFLNLTGATQGQALVAIRYAMDR